MSTTSDNYESLQHAPVPQEVLEVRQDARYRVDYVDHGVINLMQSAHGKAVLTEEAQREQAMATMAQVTEQVVTPQYTEEPDNVATNTEETSIDSIRRDVYNAIESFEQAQDEEQWDDYQEAA